jgi:hypothetical protein
MSSVVINFGRTDLINLGTITPSHFQGFLIISLDSNWINKFSEIPKFCVVINDDEKLCITSESSMKKGGKQIG